MAEMVWCNACSTVVWAYDHQRSCNLGGVINMFGLPCPNCHRTRTFDSWGLNNIDELIDQYPEDVFDAWSAMRFIAKERNLEWKPSPDNRWLIGAYEGLRQSVDRWRAERDSLINDFAITNVAKDKLEVAKLEGKIEAFKELLGEKYE